MKGAKTVGSGQPGDLFQSLTHNFRGRYQSVQYGVPSLDCAGKRDRRDWDQRIWDF